MEKSYVQSRWHLYNCFNPGLAPRFMMDGVNSDDSPLFSLQRTLKGKAVLSIGERYIVHCCGT